jgi:hypothetical protein
MPSYVTNLMKNMTIQNPCPMCMHLHCRCKKVCRDVMDNVYENVRHWERGKGWMMNDDKDEPDAQSPS